MDVKDFFKNQLTLNEELSQKFQSAVIRIASVRVTIFIIGILAFVYYVNERELAIALAVLFASIIVFALLVKKHNKLKFTRDQYRFLADINNEELARLQGDLSGIENGGDFLQIEHSYAADLDIFGDHSIFQMLNRTSTFPGKKLLATRLTGINPVTELAQYHESVAELAKNPELMQEYQALGRHVSATSEDFNSFKLWLAQPPKLSKISGLRFWLFFLPAIFILGLVLTTVLDITYYTLLPLVVINLIILGRHQKYARRVV